MKGIERKRIYNELDLHLEKTNWYQYYNSYKNNV